MASRFTLLAVLAVGAAIGAGTVATLDNGDSTPELQVARQASPDTPPAEFAYLDSARVLAYLGQIEGGLAATQTRTLSAKTTTKASITAKEVAAAEASSDRLRGSSETVTLTEADRFYTLLRILRQDQGGGGAFRTLVDIDAAITEKNSVDDVRSSLSNVDEGDFVRIRNALLFVPTYAAVLPRARLRQLSSCLPATAALLMRRVCWAASSASWARWYSRTPASPTRWRPVVLGGRPTSTVRRSPPSLPHFNAPAVSCSDASSCVAVGWSIRSAGRSPSTHRSP